jgi:Kef-type K+ transport system membrane component KefB
VLGTEPPGSDVANVLAFQNIAFCVLGTARIVIAAKRSARVETEAVGSASSASGSRAHVFAGPATIDRGARDSRRAAFPSSHPGLRPYPWPSSRTPHKEEPTDLLLMFGIAGLAGLLAGKVFQRLRIPRVVGYIVAGVVLGSSLLNVIPLQQVADLAPFTDFALALIGFMIGGELKRSVFERFGKQMVLIMLAEGLAAFVLVGALVTWLTGNLALGLLLGALSSATAPAATVDVLWEYRSRGPLTTTILGIVALDDALALILYGFAMAFASALLEGREVSLQTGLIRPLLEILGALALGFGTGWLATMVVRRLQDRDDLLALLVAVILLVAGLADWCGLSLILAEMALGVALTNLAPNSSRKAFEVVKGVTPPIYILFFILVGARLQVGLLPQMGLLGLVYVFGRTAGKMAGSWLGANATHADPAVRKYLGFALFSQAGVAVGLALAIAQQFHTGNAAAQETGTLVVNVIAATTFLVQIIGPPFVKFAISRAGEIPTHPESDHEEARGP